VVEAPASGAPQLIVPAEFAERIAGQHGDPGRDWIEGLPAVLESHLERWALAPDGHAMHGYVGMVLPVRRADGSRAGLKVSWLGGERCAKHCVVRWLRIAGGHLFIKSRTGAKIEVAKNSRR